MSCSVLSQTACTLGEGPCYDPLDHTLYWFDIVAGLMLARDAAGFETHIPLGEMASVAAPIDREHQLIATESGLYSRHRLSGARTRLVAIEDDNAATRSNDGRVHPCGALWLGTMGKQAQKGAGAIYHYGQGRLRRLYGDITIPNAICFSADGRLGYFTDTPTGLWMVVDCDPLTGLPTGEPRVFVDHRGGDGFIDGAIVDDQGRLWNARWGAGEVVCHAPDGRLLERIALPVSQPSCPVFFGPDGSQMAVTTAREGLSPADVATQPDAGKLFGLTLDIKGPPSPVMRL